MNAPAALLQGSTAIERAPEWGAFRPGFFPAMPAEEYHAIEAMSASGAKKMIRSPQHYKLMRTTPNEPTPAMQFGTAVHAAVLEPHRFFEVVVRAPDVDKRSTAGRAVWADFTQANVGKVVLAPADFERVGRCAAAVRDHPAASRLLEGAETEGSLFWIDAKYGVPCKVRYDAKNRGGLIDLKTAQDASPEGFARAAASLLYHVQDAHYRSGGEHVLGETPRFFAFVVVESEEPHAVACYTLPVEAVRVGAGLMDLVLERYAEALAMGKWKGYPQTIDTLPFPRWALKVNA